jgi:predicted transposase YdaD
VEVQGEHDPQFPERMFQYYYRIRDKYHKPITALAIFSGRMDKGKTPDRFEDICIGTLLTYKFNVLRIMDHDVERLKRSKNPFALVLWAAKTALLQGKNLDARQLNEKLLIAKALKARGMGIVEQIKQMREAQARSEGKEEGVEVGRAQMVRALLTRKGASVKKVAEMLKLSVAYVQGIKDMGQA